MQQIVQKESHEALQTIYVKEKANTRAIYYTVKQMETLLLTVSSFVFDLFISLVFSSGCIFVFQTISK